MHSTQHTVHKLWMEASIRLEEIRLAQFAIPWPNAQDAKGQTTRSPGGAVEGSVRLRLRHKICVGHCSYAKRFPSCSICCASTRLLAQCCLCSCYLVWVIVCFALVVPTALVAVAVVVVALYEKLYKTFYLVRAGLNNYEARRRLGAAGQGEGKAGAVLHGCSMPTAAAA